MSSAVCTWAAIYNPCLPIANYIIIIITKYIKLRDHTDKKKIYC